MYNRHEQIEILKSIRISEGESKTIDCPFCYGKKKFSITNKDGTLLWNCYKASCSIKGAYRKGMSLSLIKNRVGVPKESTSDYLRREIKDRGLTLRPLPSMLSQPKNHSYVMDYLEDNGCLPAYEQGLIKILYAPADNRCLFMMNNGQGAVGRSLSGATPKWMSYGDTTGVLTVGSSKTGVIVEDAPSACAVSSTGMYTGIAILGTNLSTKQKQTLKSYDKIIICLDNDAKGKAIKLLRQLQGLVECTVRFINKDLKYCRSKEIANVIESPGL
jgi:5S rRNA maturation endonuclease (ribonuclease M5)